MKNAAFRTWAVVSCLAFGLIAAVLAAQLPPDVQVDRLWLRAERQIGDGDHWSALGSLDEILDLQARHGLAIPVSFWFSHAVASHRAGLHMQASVSATRYVEATGRNGEHYLAALELLDAAEAAAEREVSEARRLAAQRERAERAAEARQSAIDAQAEAAAAADQEMAEVAAELVRLAPGMEMVVVPAGHFRMGCVSGEGCLDDELPVHDVTISRPFAVSKHEVTYTQWSVCASGGGCPDHREEGRRRRRARGYWPEQVFEEVPSSRRPVTYVSWLDAQNYVRWLSQETGARYRLLSESEWEYVARAGTSTAYSWGNEIGTGRANCNGCTGRSVGILPVGSFSPNPWGFYDMHGNVSEWVQDCSNSDYGGAPSDGSAWQQGDCSHRVLRSGNYQQGAWGSRSAFRMGVFEADTRFYAFGFRVAREIIE